MTNKKHSKWNPRRPGIAFPEVARRKNQEPKKGGKHDLGGEIVVHGKGWGGG